MRTRAGRVTSPVRPSRPSVHPTVRQDITQEDIKLAAAVAKSESAGRDGEGCGFDGLVSVGRGGVAAATGFETAPSGGFTVCLSRARSSQIRLTRDSPFLRRWTSPRAWCVRRGRKRATATRSRSTTADSSWMAKSSTPASTATSPSHSILALDRDVNEYKYRSFVVFIQLLFR